MSCPHEREVELWHDGELSSQQREWFAPHLSGCETCQRELRELESLSRFLRPAPRRSMPAEALARVHSTIQQLGERSVLRIAEWLTAAAAIILGIGLAFLIHGRTMPQRPIGGAVEVAADVTMPDEVVSGVEASSGNAVELAQWVEPAWRQERQP